MTLFEALKFNREALKMLVRLGENKALGNPFGNCGKVEFNAQMNYSAKYTDIMLYKKQDEKQTSSAA